MSRIAGWFKAKFSNIDKDDALKWSFIIGGGLLSLVGGVFDQRKKDRLYKEGLADEIKEQSKKILEQVTGGNAE